MAAPFLLGLALVAAAQGTGRTTPLSLNGSRAIPDGSDYWINPIDDFPVRARRAGESGIVTARLFVDGTGQARGCLILGGPHVPALEAATCRTLLRRARFQPFVGDGLATYDYRVFWDSSRLPPIRQPDNTMPPPRVEWPPPDVATPGPPKIR